jgi:hypothetical protein
LDDSRESFYIQCLILKEDVEHGQLARMLKSWQSAFQRAGSPVRAFALASTRKDLMGTRIWVSSSLAEILDRSEPGWRQYIRHKSAVLPGPSEAVLCVGDPHVLDEVW